MYNDPIVEQTRALRDEYAKRFNYDLDAICDDLMDRQRNSNRKLIRREPKRLTPVASEVAQVNDSMGRAAP